MRPVDGALTEGGFGSQLTSIPYSYLVRKNWSIFALVAVFSTALLLTVPSGSLLSSGIQGSDVSTESSISKFTADMTDPKVLNVHVVPHTHDDVGWLKTVDQYYFGLNNSIQHASVHDILDSVVASLLDNPSRTFTYVEQKFFSMWWERQNDAVKDAVRFLVGNKQLGFVNGGWCMHDEATTHFMGMIDQTTLGHTFLKKELSVVPSVGWQLDPFGHSATQASLMTSKVGFDALYFGRIDYQDLELRRLTRECEGLWNSTGGGGGDSTIFWGLTGSYGGNYGAPNGFCFDQFCHDPDLTKINNLSKAIVDFLHKIRRQSDETKGNHIMLTMGSDFQYEIARRNFASLDVLIGSVMDFQLWEKVDIPSIFGPRFDRVQIFYSSPEYYTECKFNEMKSATPEMRVEGKRESISHKDMRYSVKQDDFFPYSDCPDCFWTGYFTSRTGLKRQERVASSFLMAARQIESLIDYTGKTDPIQCTAGFRELEDALGVVQHHDGVSGTAKQHVANDYAKRVQGGINRVEKCTARKFKRLFFGVNASKSLGDLSHCQLLNETICEVSQKATRANGTDVYVVVYNSLGQSRSSVIRLPVSSNGTYLVTRFRASGDDARLLPAISSWASGASYCAAKYVLPFQTGLLPPVGASVFRISKQVEDQARQKAAIPQRSSATWEEAVEYRHLESAQTHDGALKADVEVSNGLLTVIFDGENGMMKQISTNGTTMDVSQTWGYYTSFDADFDSSDSEKNHQNSGAYIFRPKTPEEDLTVIEPSKSAFFTPLLGGMEVHVEFEHSWIRTTTRVLPGLPYVEVDYTIGPIPIDDGRGKEIVTRFNSPIESAGAFSTDSNAREFLKRKRNYRPTWDLNVWQPVAGNYYPVNAAIFIEDTDSAFSVVTDRTQGGASLVDGSVELMVQRRTLADDGRGVGEAMNETKGGMSPYPPYGKAQRLGEGVVIKGTHRIMIGNSGGAKLARSMMDGAFAEPLVFVGSSTSDESVSFQVPNISGLQGELPPNIMLITLARLHDAPTTTFLLRLGHQYGAGEDELLSQPASVDIASLFTGYNVVNVVEKTLTGNQDYGSWMKRRLDWTGDNADLSKSRNAELLASNVVLLEPLDIRSFEITVDANEALVK